MGFASETVVIKSPTDRRLYRIIHLPNGLCALLVHDPEIFPEGLPDGARRNGDMEEEEEVKDEEEGSEDDDEDEDCDEEEEEEEEEEEDDDDGGGKRKKGGFPTKKAAAAVCVGIGSFTDPSKAQGLAHFLEHMLFMGSTEFPDENEPLAAVSLSSAVVCSTSAARRHVVVVRRWPLLAVHRHRLPSPLLAVYHCRCRHSPLVAAVCRSLSVTARGPPSSATAASSPSSATASRRPPPSSLAVHRRRRSPSAATVCCRCLPPQSPAIVRRR